MGMKKLTVSDRGKGLCQGMTWIDIFKETAKRDFQKEAMGDFPMEEVQKKTGSFEFGMEHIDEYFGNPCNNMIECTR
jgi:hypothetical protein